MSGSITPRHGVISLFGFGSSARVDRGHLVLEDGIGLDRRHARLPRVNHGLKRLVVIGSDGMVSFAALRWLADQNATFAMLDKDGTVLVTTGPVRSSDARLRRTQALAHHSGVAILIARELISKKLIGQADLCRRRICNITAAEAITAALDKVPKAKTISQLRLVEAQAAASYWSAWHELPITYPRADLPRVPDHWSKFGNRKSSISGSPRLAINPPNAILNYLYALLESESRLALAALGLDLNARDTLLAYHALSNHFASFFGRLNPGTSFESTASSQYNTIKGLIEDRSGAAASLSPVCFLQGSYKQQTAIYSINDVDIVVLCRLWSPGSGGGRTYGRDEIFETIASPLRQDGRYKTKLRFGPSSMCIKVDLGIKVEILPVVFKAGNSDYGQEPFHLYRPSSQRWEDGFARYHQYYLSAKNKDERTGGKTFEVKRYGIYLE